MSQPTTSSDSTSGQAGTQRCHLLRLPPELRNRIYDYLFAGPEEREVEVFEARAQYPGSAIIATCRQLSRETRVLQQQAVKSFHSDHLFYLALSPSYLLPDLLFSPPGHRPPQARPWDAEALLCRAAHMLVPPIRAFWLTEQVPWTATTTVIGFVRRQVPQVKVTIHLGVDRYFTNWDYPHSPEEDRGHGPLVRKVEGGEGEWLHVVSVLQMLLTPGEQF